MRTIGEFAKARIFRLNFSSVDEFLAANPDAISKPTLYKFFREGGEGKEVRTKELIAKSLRFNDWSELQTAFEADDVTWGLVSRYPLPPKRILANRRPILPLPPKRIRSVPTPEPLDPNVEPYSENRVDDVPAFDLAVAAGTWVEVAEIAELYDGRQIDHGLFRIRIRGDSMTPRFADGRWVQFKCLRAGRDVVEIGGAYYVQKNDGTATFKLVSSMDENMIVLKAINKKYPPMRVHRADVVRMAKAEWLLEKI